MGHETGVDAYDSDEELVQDDVGNSYHGYVTAHTCTLEGVSFAFFGRAEDVEHHDGFVVDLENRGRSTKAEVQGKWCG